MTDSPPGSRLTLIVDQATPVASNRIPPREQAKALRLLRTLGLEADTPPELVLAWLERRQGGCSLPEAARQIGLGNWLGVTTSLADLSQNLARFEAVYALDSVLASLATLTQQSPPESR
ncbi:hypothetical protein [Pseudomonas oryzihabitans]|uniref:hypothetical protein n=1 Tax=Pseudomonas oryzihabitans TaxID=47885 RepID=UPI0028543A06|nr:hypothetical protein [Pseudomonas psychrotolerans]MDR6679334.1 hypothetical protein [Pseudomonas psychrotolerans]